MFSDDESSPKRLRSPPYPFIPLAKAVERAKQLYPKALHHPIGMAVLADAWGYGLKSSGLIQTAAALIQFGLLIDEGSGDKRKFQLTKDALRIVQDSDPNSERRKELIRTAARKPKIHKELWGKYGPGNVSDVLLQNYLMFDRSNEDGAAFGPEAASQLVAEYKASIAYAELTDSDAKPLTDGIGEKVDGKENHLVVSEQGEHDATRGRSAGARPTKKVGMNEDVFSLKEGDVVLQWPIRLSPESYEDLEAWAQIILRKIKRSVAKDGESNEDVLK